MYCSPSLLFLMCIWGCFIKHFLLTWGHHSTGLSVVWGSEMRNLEKACHKAHSSTFRGGWEGRFCCSGSPPPCAYQRQKTTRDKAASQRNTTKPLKLLIGLFTGWKTTYCEKLSSLPFYFYAIIKKRGLWRKGWCVWARDPVTDIQTFSWTFFGSGGRANLQLSRPDLFSHPSMNASN